MRVEFLTPANLDYVDAIDFYESQRSGLGLSFVEDVERSIDLIARFPALGSPAVEGTRRVHLLTFPYALVYRQTLDRIVIIAVESYSRAPGFWRDRM